MHGRQISRRLACLSHARYWTMLEASQITRSRLKAPPSSTSSRSTVFPITTMRRQGQRAIRRPASYAPKLGRVLESHHPARR